ncbi:MAG: hypothetical protein ACOCQR_00990 [bacterium]
MKKIYNKGLEYSKKKLREFEKKYNYTSQEFYEEYKNGNSLIPDDYKASEWAFEYEIYHRIKNDEEMHKILSEVQKLAEEITLYPVLSKNHAGDVSDLKNFFEKNFYIFEEIVKWKREVVERQKGTRRLETNKEVWEEIEALQEQIKKWEQVKEKLEDFKKNLKQS